TEPTKPTVAEKRMQQVAARLGETLVDDEGRPADKHVVEEVVAERAAALEEAPVQEFVPLLVENQAGNDLRERGLRRTWDDDEGGENDDGGETDSGGETDASTGPVPESPEVKPDAPEAETPEHASGAASGSDL